METFVKGEVVVLPFPFTDLSFAKRRPALVVANLSGDDLILCQITSQTRFDEYSIALESHDFEAGNLEQISMIRPNRLFTADRSIILYKIGLLKENKIREVADQLIKIFN